MHAAGENAYALTVTSAYGCKGNAASWACSSSAAVRGMGSCEPTRSESCWQLAGTPVMGSRRVFRCAMVHEGDMRRSDDELAELMIRGTSAAASIDMSAVVVRG